MTQPGKRRREGVVEPPDLEGLYPSLKSVKKRRTGVVQPPNFAELQLPERPRGAAPQSADCTTSTALSNEELLVDKDTSNGVSHEQKDAEIAERTFNPVDVTTSEEDSTEDDGQPHTSPLDPSPPPDSVSTEEEERVDEKNEVNLEEQRESETTKLATSPL